MRAATNTRVPTTTMQHILDVAVVLGAVNLPQLNGVLTTTRQVNWHKSVREPKKTLFVLPGATVSLMVSTTMRNFLDVALVLGAAALLLICQKRQVTGVVTVGQQKITNRLGAAPRKQRCVMHMAPTQVVTMEDTLDVAHVGAVLLLFK